MAEGFFSFAATEVGYNHKKAEPSKVCEDASGFYDDELMSICVVADGHGSDNYPRTDRGSKYAVQAAVEQIKSFVNSIYRPSTEYADSGEEESKELIDRLLQDKITDTHPLKNLSQSILARWYELVEDDFVQTPFIETELALVSEKYRKRYLSNEERREVKAYGCTLIAYVVTEKFSFGLQIGDGKCVVIDRKGTFSEPIPWDENCQLNITTSICDSDAGDEFRFYVTNNKPAAVFCGSDGIDDSYASAEEVYALYRSILKIFIEHGTDVGKNEIKEYLPLLTKRGSGDDVSIALIMDAERVKSLATIFEMESELFDLYNQIKEKQHVLAVNEEKEKALSSKHGVNVSLRPGNRTLIDIDAIRKINDLRVRQRDLDGEISGIRKRIDGLNEKIGKAVVEIDQAKVEKQGIVKQEMEPNVETEDDQNDITESNSDEVMPIVMGECKNSIVSVESGSSEKGSSVCGYDQRLHEYSDGKIIISEKTIPIVQQIDKISNNLQIDTDVPLDAGSFSEQAEEVVTDIVAVTNQEE